ncbi:HD domain-containing protein [Actinomadura graeca]|uniref:HD domain-containing protein n=1 Tax=Actinomadura graeca TaxID=2750812 RepID=A0ABX8QT73_9ACTN|nr:HD domain-containing protein [Actinomadura graeca]QXJ20622.1 HD domain-containing protein [Actinomadura graeca]
MKNTAAWARDLARKHLETPLPRRWAHTQGVARQARTLAPILGDQADLLEAAAWLHDIGYAPDLVDTGFHPLDGARYLRDTHEADTHLCRLVAHHSCAMIEARERDMSSVWAQDFGGQTPLLNDFLTYCDMTTSPQGEVVAVGERLTEIQIRYERTHAVSRAIRQASPALTISVRRVENMLRAKPVNQQTRPIVLLDR